MEPVSSKSPRFIQIAGFLEKEIAQLFYYWFIIYKRMKLSKEKSIQS
jgi:hypothetical protein